MEFRDTEFEMAKAWKALRERCQKIQEGCFTNADSIRNLEDDMQLALKLWNLPKFKTFEELYEWLGLEHSR